MRPVWIALPYFPVTVVTAKDVSSACIKMDPPLRDRAIVELAKFISIDRIAQLQFHQVANIDPKTKYVEVHVPIQLDKGQCLAADDNLMCILEDYLNAQPPGRPFLDFRPDVGCYLFPSPRTGAALSSWAVRSILQGKPGRKRLRNKETDHMENNKTNVMRVEASGS